MSRVITIDGPSGSGKGTIANRVAEHLGWHCLDSGALYRLLGLSAERAGIGFDQAEYKQLMEKGLDANLVDLVAEIRERDDRDRNRNVAPLKAPEGALEVESTALSIDQVLEQVMERVFSIFPELK
jgi:cytidylate kinase